MENTDPTVVVPYGEQDPKTGLHRWYDLTPEAHLGSKVAQLRKGRGWSQTDLARRLAAQGFELHQTTIAKLEGGGRPIRLNEVFALAAVFEVDPGDLIRPPAKDADVAARDAALLKLQEVKAELKEVNLAIEELTRRKGELGRERSERLKEYHRARKAVERGRNEVGQGDGEH